MSAGETTYETVVEPGDYEDVNPLGGEAPAFYAGLQDYMGNLQNLMGQGFQTAGSYDPTAFMNQFMGAIPGLMGITTAATSPLAQAHQTTLQSMIDPTVAGIGQAMSGLGAVHSSAFPEIVGQQMAQAATQAGVNLAQQRSNIFGSLAGTAMPLFAQGGQYGAGLDMQGAGIAGNLYGNLAGIGAGMVTPNMVGPTVGANIEPSWWETWGQPLLGMGGTLVGGIIPG